MTCPAKPARRLNNLNYVQMMPSISKYVQPFAHFMRLTELQGSLALLTIGYLGTYRLLISLAQIRFLVSYLHCNTGAIF